AAARQDGLLDRGLAPGLLARRRRDARVGGCGVLHRRALRRGLAEKGQVGAVAFLFELAHRAEAERSGVDAVTQSAGSGTVVEDVAEVRVGALRTDLRARHTVARVVSRNDVLGLDGFGEARPARAGLELVGRAEQRLTAHDVDVEAGVVVVPETVAKSGLC